MPRPLTSWPNLLLASLAIALVGGLLSGTRFGDPLARLSYDLPFVWRGRMNPPPVALIYLDEESLRELRHPADELLDRRHYARLLQRLTRDHARAVLFDIVFAQPSGDPEVDAEFARAMRAQAAVVLTAGLEVATEMGVGVQRVIAPAPVLREAAAGWGLASFQPDADQGVRLLFPGTESIPSATAALAKLLGQPTDFTAPRWLNFYGPPDWLPRVNLVQALRDDGVAPGFFRDRIVLVGGRPNLSTNSMAKDEFAGPWSRWLGRFYPGLELHATALLNQLDGTWLRRLPWAWELAILLAVAAVAGAGLNLLTPARAVVAGLVSSALLLAAAFATAWSLRVWWTWLIPAAVQIPLGVAWSVGTQYFVEARRRAALRRAFSLYLSPHMAERISELQLDLAPGGHHVEATVMFTDLAGFSTLAEELDDPEAVAAVLNQYFTRTTACILDNDGTIIKYMGDAVEAVWNVPLTDPAHAVKAARAACRLREVSSFEANGRTIRTRIGINTGPAFAGNLGSAFRFDYAVIGDTTNFASRLEGLNKSFGTEILISEALMEKLGGAFVTRRLGRVRVAGKSRPVRIFELLAPREEWSDGAGWLETFHQGLSQLEAGDRAGARALLEQARRQRGGADGPSEFFLSLLARWDREGALEPWDGVVEFSSK